MMEGLTFALETESNKLIFGQVDDLYGKRTLSTTRGATGDTHSCQNRLGPWWLNEMVIPRGGVVRQRK